MRDATLAHRHDTRPPMPVVFRLLLVLLLLPFAIPADARHWLVVGAEGDGPPHRSLYYAEFESPRTRFEMPLDQAATAGADALLNGKLQQLWVVQVQESGNTDFTWYTVDVHCARRELRIAEVIAFELDGRQHTVTPNQWVKIGNAGWPSRVHLIACDPARLNVALRKAKDGNLRPLNDLGMAYAGEYVLYSQLADLAWEQFWKDGKRPPRSSHLTAGQSAKLRDDTLALAAATEQKLKDTEKETRFILEVSDNFDRKSDSHQREFAGMEGWTEEQIIDAWGAPASAAQGGQTRSLVYTYQKERYDVVTDRVGLLMGRQGPVGELTESRVETSLQDCKRMLSLRQGGSKPGWRLYDYRYDCP